MEGDIYMSTYVYEYRRHGKGEMISKYTDGVGIFDLRGVKFESSGTLIAKVRGNYLYKYLTSSCECTEFFAEGNILYRKTATGKEPILIAKNTIIYSYDSYIVREELAEYYGHSKEALFAYMALKVARKTATNLSNNKNNSSAQKTSSSSSLGAGGETLMTIIAFSFFFIIAAILTTLLEFYEYYTIVHIVVPSIVIAIIFLKRQIADEEYEHSVSSFVISTIKGIGIGLLSVFVIAPIDMFINEYIKFDRTLLISIDTAYTVWFCLVVVITVMLSAKKKNK